MTDKIVAFPGTRPAHEPLDASAIIATLEGLLVRARAGEISGIAFAACHPNTTITTGWDGTDNTRFPLGAAVMALHHRYSNSLIGLQTPVVPTPPPEDDR